MVPEANLDATLDPVSKFAETQPQEPFGAEEGRGQLRAKLRLVGEKTRGGFSRVYLCASVCICP